MKMGASCDPIVLLLDRIRGSLYVRSAVLRLSGDDGLPIVISAGAPIPDSSVSIAESLQELAAAATVFISDLDLEHGALGRPVSSDSHRIRFYAGIPLVGPGGRLIGVLSLFHTQPRLLSAAQRQGLEDLAADLEPVASRRADALTIARLRERLERQTSLMQLQAAEFQQRLATLEGAAAAAKMGIWECTLRDESLDWTGQVYDLFELPRGAALSRGAILDCYTAASLSALNHIRSGAIAARRGFQLDAEIATLKGHRRWIRINAVLGCRDGVPIRLFGAKRDITEEKLLLESTRRLAWVDALTGLANRARFEARLADFASGRRGKDTLAAMLLVDLDGFKQINDGFGHAVGDRCLKEVARRLRMVCHGAELVARIGGDEFAILLGGDAIPAAIEALADAIVDAVCRPFRLGSQNLDLGTSVGIAEVCGPVTSSELFARADTALYAAKAAGRGTFRFFDPAMAQAEPWRLA